MPAMVAKVVGGNPATPAASPVTTMPKKRTVVTSAVTTKKVAKVKGKKIPTKKPNKLVTKKKVKK